MNTKPTIIICLSFLSVITFFFSCSKKKEMVSRDIKSSTLRKYDTIASLDKMQGDTCIWKIDNQYIMVIHEKSTDEEFENDLNVNHLRSACAESFGGSARSAAKTSYVTGAFIPYTHIANLRLSLPSDALMHTKGLGLSSPRINEEKKNVSVASAYLYAISRESDNDYHMIIGDASVSPTTLMNCESSGLSSTTSTSYLTIKNVRSVIKQHFGTDFCNTSGYTRFSPAIHISVLKGSLFYDIDHAAGTIGPLGYRANTSWEIHPVNAIAF